jgi:hypothetical protein
MFKDIFKLYPETPLFSGPLSQHNGVVSYDLKIEEEMTTFCSDITKRYIDKSQIFNCSD